MATAPWKEAQDPPKSTAASLRLPGRPEDHASHMQQEGALWLGDFLQDHLQDTSTPRPQAASLQPWEPAPGQLGALVPTNKMFPFTVSLYQGRTETFVLVFISPRCGTMVRHSRHSINVYRMKTERINQGFCAVRSSLQSKGKEQIQTKRWSLDTWPVHFHQMSNTLRASLNPTPAKAFVWMDTKTMVSGEKWK